VVASDGQNGAKNGLPKGLFNSPKLRLTRAKSPYPSQTAAFCGYSAGPKIGHRPRREAENLGR